MFNVQCSMFNVQCSIFLLVSESTPFLALPGKHLPRAQIIFVVRAGRKFRIFSLTVQRYKNFKALPNYSSQKARKKARSENVDSNLLRCFNATVKNTAYPKSKICFIFIYIIIYINITVNMN